jgi:hypothetical protein
MSDASASRVRWDQDELTALAAEMAVVLKANPATGMLSALRTAQERVLQPDRQREIKAWSVVEGRLGALLRDAQAKSNAGPTELQSQGGGQAATDGVATEAVIGDGTAEAQMPGGAHEVQIAGGAEGSAVEAADHATHEASGAAVALDAAVDRQVPMGVPSGGTAMGKPSEAQAEREPGPDPAQQAEGLLGAKLASVLEAALLVALQSPQVEDEFAKVLGRAMGRATAQNGVQEHAEQGTTKVMQRVLLAGFPGQMAKGIESELREHFDVRSWTPGQSAQVFDTLTRMCSVAVIPEEAEDEMGDVLKKRDMQVVRHTGSAKRLAERLSTLMS